MKWKKTHTTLDYSSNRGSWKLYVYVCVRICIRWRTGEMEDCFISYSVHGKHDIYFLSLQITSLSFSPIHCTSDQCFISHGNRSLTQKIRIQVQVPCIGFTFFLYFSLVLYIIFVLFQASGSNVGCLCEFYIQFHIVCFISLARSLSQLW